MKIKIALAGNPNSGKTTLFNELTGSSQYVGNWPGVTVEKKEGKLKGHKDITIIDLPGIYSLSPYTIEEVVSRNFLINERPDVIINIIDATNIERNLYLTTQLLELGIPVVVALNMMDIVNKTGEKINIKKLSAFLECDVVEISALKCSGINEIVKKSIEAAQKQSQSFNYCKILFDINYALQDILMLIKDNVDEKLQYWYALKLFEKDKNIVELLNLPDKISEQIRNIVKLYETKVDDDSESIITNERYSYIDKLMSECVIKKHNESLSISDKIDKIVTNRWLALPVFFAVMFIVYYLSVTTIGTLATDLVNDILFGEMIPNVAGSFLKNINCAEWLSSLILDGIIAGVGAVIGFLPQMLMLFLLLAILEDSGYMSRIAFIMDRIFRKFGLSGKSFIPMLIGTGCGVPAVMASRTIENERDRKMTIMTTTFVPCSAKIPIIALIAGALFPNSSLVAPSAYFIGIAAIIISGIILKKTKVFTGEPAPFVMELPAYHMPSLKGILIHMWDRTKSFVKKAGTIIFLACGLIWFLSTFNFNFQMVDETDSMLASIGSVAAPIFKPLGWGNWQATVATITGLVAKENVVSTLGILYGFDEVAENGMEIWDNLRNAFTALSAYSFLIFNLLCAPCFAAIGAIKREMGNNKWTLIAVGYQTMFAYAISFIVYQLGMIFTGNGFNVSSIFAVVLLLMFVYLLFRPAKI